MTLTNIYSLVKMDEGGLDYGECCLELNNTYLIDFPIGLNAPFLIDKRNKDSLSLFDNLDDIPTYKLNKDEKTIEEIRATWLRWPQ